jgi:prolyl-tRNA synthetase
MGVLAEYFADDKGLVWPEAIAPAKVIIVAIGNEPEVKKQADKLFEEIAKENVAVIYDDRDARPGEKLADADLLGIPYRIVVSKKTIADGKAELKYRMGHKTELLTPQRVISKLSA